MTSQKANKKTLKVTVFLRDGTKNELTESVANGSGDAVDLKLLCKSLVTLQSRTNDELTRLVEEERESRAVNSQQNNTKDEDNAEEDEDENDDDDEPPKKLKKR